MKTYSIVLLLLLSLTLSAQKGTIKGKIVDAKTNDPVEFAAVLIQGTTIGTTSDIEGNFQFNEVAPGFKRLLVSSVGFKTTESSEIQVQGNQTVFIDVAILESAVQLNEVTVRQNLTVKKIESPISVISIGVQQIEKSAGANRDITKVVQALPGVSATDPNRSDLIVRGGGPSENVFYLDGIEIPVINHFATQGSSGGSVGIVNPDFVREINFYTGAFPANRGNALSSVMEIRQKDGDKDHIHSKLSVGASDAALTINGPIGKKSTFIVSARQSYLQFLFAAIGLPFLPTYNDFQLKYKIQLDPKNEISVIGIGAIDDMKLNTGIENPTESQVNILSYLPTYKQWNYALGTVYKHYAATHFDTWVLSRNMLRNANFKYINNIETNGKSSDYRSDEAENKLRFERNFPDLPIKFSYGGGVKYAHYTNATFRQFSRIPGKVETLNYNTEINLFGYQAFAQASKTVFDERLKLSLGVNMAGLDYNQNMRNPLNQFSPRLSGSLALTDKLDLNANVGRYAMQPVYTTLGYKNAAGEFANKNENLRFTVSNQAIVGFEYRPVEQARMTVEAFYKQYGYYPLSVRDGQSTASKGTTYGQVGDEEIISAGKGRAYGIEFLSKIMEMNNMNLTATYTYFRSEFTNSAGKYVRSSWDTKQQLNLIASYKLPRNWNVAIRWRFVGGAPYTPIDNAASTNRNTWNITKQATLDYTKFNELSLPNAQQLDVRIDKEFYFKTWTLNLYTDIQNATNFKTKGAPIYTNLDSNGAILPDATDRDKQGLRTLESLGGTILPTIGIIIKI